MNTQDHIDSEPGREQRDPRVMRRRQRRILLLGLIAIVAGAVALQLVPYGRNHTNPAVVREPTWDSPETRALAVSACFDCHSNETRWPWYSNIAPVSMMVYHDVVEGREALNFSEWNSQAWNKEKNDRLAELVGKGEMPLPYYVVLHPDAQLSTSQQGQLVNGLLKTLQP